MSKLERQLEDTWGESASKFADVISLAEQRLQECHRLLAKGLDSKNSPYYEVIGMGYKAVQTARAIQVLCSSGYADQANVLCRTLQEQMVNVWFMMTSGNAEEVIQRYCDWQFASFYRDLKRRKNHLSKSGRGPTVSEWQELNTRYEATKKLYASLGDNIDIREAWAIAYRENGTRKVKAQNLLERAKQCLPWLKDDERLLYEIFEMEHQRLNEFVHTTPQSIFQSQSSPSKDVIATGPSVLGLGDPMRLAGTYILNLSSAVTMNMHLKKSHKMKRLDTKIMKAVKELAKAVSESPESAQPWWRRKAGDK